MTKNEILKKIGIIISELKEQYDIVQENQDDINDIELELFAANSHFLTDHIEILRRLNNLHAKPLREPKPEHEIQPEERHFEPVVVAHLPVKNEIVPAPVELDIPKEEPAVTPGDTNMEQTAPVNDDEFFEDEDVADSPEENNPEELWIDRELAEMKADDEQKETIHEPETHTPEPTPYTPYTPEPEPYTAAPEFIAPEPEVTKTEIIINDTDEKPLITINQMISAQVAPRYADNLELQPIKDLKSAINLNDKLLFVRDLFNGYSMAYGEALEILNRFNKFEEADQFLKLNYYTKNNWEAKQDTTDKFYTLLKRRFIN